MWRNLLALGSVGCLSGHPWEAASVAPVCPQPGFAALHPTLLGVPSDLDDLDWLYLNGFVDGAALGWVEDWPGTALASPTDDTLAVTDITPASYTLAACLDRDPYPSDGCLGVEDTLVWSQPYFFLADEVVSVEIDLDARQFGPLSSSLKDGSCP